MTSEKKKGWKKTEELRKDYLSVLPGFLSQLLLLMNSGMILQKAMERLAESCGKMPESQKKQFHRELESMYLASRRTGENMVVLFFQFGRNSGVKELSRAAGIMMENLDKGTDLWDKLAREGEQLWQERKRMALETIRVGESKMSFPLGLLLMALLLVTAAPALMQIS